MNDSTKNKFAEILAAAQAKEQAKVKPLTQATGQQTVPAKIAPQPQPTPTPAAIQQPKPTPPDPVFKPHVKDIFPDIATDTPELSNVTFADLMKNSDKAETTPTTGEIEMVEYSPLSFVVKGEGTRKIKDQLMEKGGAFNRFLKCGPGFVFSKKKYYTIKTMLETLQVK